MDDITIQQGEIQINPPQDIETIKEDIKSINSKLADVHPTKGEVN